MSNAVKTWHTKKKWVSTDDMGLCRIKYYVPAPVKDKQIEVIPYVK